MAVTKGTRTGVPIYRDVVTSQARRVGGRWTAGGAMADPRSFTAIVSPSPTVEDGEQGKGRVEQRHYWEVRDTTRSIALASGYADGSEAAQSEADKVLEEARKAEAERLSGYENPLALDDPELAAHPEKVLELQRAAAAGDLDATQELAQARPPAQAGLAPAAVDAEAVERGRESRAQAVQGGSDASESGLANAEEPVQALGPDDAGVKGPVEQAVEDKGGKSSGTSSRSKR